jgi:hypothetical protein
MMPDALSDSYSLTVDEIGYLKKFSGFLPIHPRDVSQSRNDEVGAKIKTLFKFISHTPHAEGLPWTAQWKSRSSPCHAHQRCIKWRPKAIHEREHGR